MHCLLDSLTPLGLASLQKSVTSQKSEWARKLFRVSSTMASEENPTLCIYVPSINEQPGPASITPVTWAKLQQLKLRTWPARKALKQSIKCRGFVFLCSVIYHMFWLFVWAPWRELLCFLADTLTFSWPFPLCMALPRKLLLWRDQWWVPDLKQQNSTLPWSGSCLQCTHTATCEGQGLQHSWGWQEQLCAHHITPPNQRDKDKLARGQWEAPLSSFLAAPQDLFLPLCDCAWL